MCTLVQLMPANLLTVVPWLSATILPYLLAHRLHQMVPCSSVMPLWWWFDHSYHCRRNFWWNLGMYCAVWKSVIKSVASCAVECPHDCCEPLQPNWPANALSLTEQLLPLILELCPCPGCPPDLSPLTDLQATLIKLTSVLSIVHSPLSLTVYEQV